MIWGVRPHAGIDCGHLPCWVSFGANRFLNDPPAEVKIKKLAAFLKRLPVREDRAEGPLTPLWRTDTGLALEG